MGNDIMGKKIIITADAIEKSPFGRYRVGYIDGYVGKDVAYATDKVYTSGYEEGACDDRMGMPPKYDTDGHK
jgi:hypothetical protein